MRQRNNKTMKGNVKEKDVQRFVLTDTGRVVLQKELDRFEIPATKQLEEADWKKQSIIQPPFDLGRLMSWLDISVAHNSAIRTKVQDSFGVGWDLNKVDDAARDDDYDDLKVFFNHINEDGEDITSVMDKVGLDFEGNGNGTIEVVRGSNGKVAALYHVPSTTVRISKDKRYFVQIVGDKKRFFKAYGEEEALNKETGKFGVIENPEKVASEMIQLKAYSWKTQAYGLPGWLPAIMPMFGEQMEKEYNSEFFANFGIPAYAVILEGWKTGQKEVIDQIKQYFEADVKKNLHRTMVFRPPAGGKVIFEPLNTQTKEASFRLFRRDNRDDILSAHRVPPYRAGIVVQGQLGGQVAAEVDRIYLTSVINPRQRAVEQMLTNLVIREGLEIEGWRFIFDDIVIDDRSIQSKIDETYLRNGVRTPNEIRVDMGLDPYEGGDVFILAQSQTNVIGPEETRQARIEEGAEPEPQAQEQPKGYGGVVVLGKAKRKNKEETLSKAILPQEDRKQEAVAQRGVTDLEKEFRRQGRALVEWLNKEGILEAIHEDAQKLRPEAFEKREKSEELFYETIDKQDPEAERRITQFVAGWETAIKAESMAKVLEILNKRMGNPAGAQALRKLGFRINFNLKNPELLKTLKDRGARITGEISKTTLANFRTIMRREFYEKGQGPPVVARKIRDLFAKTYKKRAETIARTEAGIASATVQHEAYVKNGVGFKEWATFMDGKQRDSHGATNGQQKPLEDAFVLIDPTDGSVALLQHPRDVTGPAEEVINCRCAELPVVSDPLNRADVWTGE